MQLQYSVIGIDPGKYGAAALIPAGCPPLIHDFSDITSAADTLKNWWLDYDIAAIFIEKVHAMPKQGVVSMFSFGMNYGMWQGICQALGIRIVYVSPATWQTYIFNKYSATSQGKAKSLEVARALFPEIDLRLKKYHNRAEALLIAQYGYDSFR